MKVRRYSARRSFLSVVLTRCGLATVAVVVVLAALAAAPATGAASRTGSVNEGPSLVRNSTTLATPAPSVHFPATPASFGQETEPGGDVAASTPALRGAAPAFPHRLAGSLRTPSAAAATPFVGGSWDGSSSGLVDPADAQIGVGQADVVEMTNASATIWTKTGQQLDSETLGSFFSSSNVDRRSDFMTDPRVVYDSTSGRWFFIAYDKDQQQMVMRISDSEDPTGSSYLYWFPSSGCPDQPRLAVSSDMVAFADNFFSDCGTFGYLIGGEVTLLDKATLLDHGQAQTVTYGPDLRFSSITPVQPLNGLNGMWFVASDYYLDAADIFWATAVNQPSLPIRYVPLNALNAPPPSLQSDPDLIDSGDNRVQDAVYENGSIYLAFTDGCSANGESGYYACGRFVSIDTSSLSATMDCEVVLAGDRDLFYPQIMPAGDGSIFAVFGYSSSGETPSIGYIENPQDPGATWNQLTVGTGANESGRWGDYFGIARDPADSSHIWIAGQYGEGGDSWGTTVAALGEAPFSITPPAAAPPTTAPPVKPVTHKKPVKHKKRNKRS